MPALIVTGDDRDIVATLTIDKSTETAGTALSQASTVKACLLNQITRVALTPVYTISSGNIDTTNATVTVSIPGTDSASLDPSVQTVLEIELTNGSGKKITFTDLGPILIKKGVIP